MQSVDIGKMFALITVISMITAVSSLAKWNWCYPDSYKDDPKKVELAKQIKYFKQQAIRTACYFYVECATDECNLPKGKRASYGPVTFDLDQAREICKKFNATLPTITGPDEMAYVHAGFEQHGLKLGIVLGLTKVHGKGEILSWDDNTPVKTYLPTSEWVSMEKNNLTYVKPSDGTNGAKWYSDDFEGNHGVLNVYCKQNATIPLVTTTTTQKPQTEKPDNEPPAPGPGGEPATNAEPEKKTPKSPPQKSTCNYADRMVVIAMITMKFLMI